MDHGSIYEMVRDYKFCRHNLKDLLKRIRNVIKREEAKDDLKIFGVSE